MNKAALEELVLLCLLQAGGERPLRTSDELRNAIHVNKLQWDNDEGWEEFWAMLFDSE